MSGRPKLQLEGKRIIYLIAIASSILVWAFFLNASGITVQSLLSFAKLGENIARLASINFLLFLLTFPLTYALIIVLCRRESKRAMQLLCIIGFEIAAIISILAFSSIQNHIVLGAFYLASLLLAVEAAHTSFLELKKMVAVRAAFGSASKATLAVTLGIFILSALTVMPSQRTYSAQFEQWIISSLSLGMGDGQQGINEMSADLYIKIQGEQLESTMGTQYYKKLVEKEDVDVKAFVLMMEKTAEAVHSPEYRRQLIVGMKEKQTAQEMGSGSIFDRIKESSPIFTVMESFFWFLEAFLLTSIFMLIAKCIIGPLTAIYVLALDLALPKAGEAC